MNLRIETRLVLTLLLMFWQTECSISSQAHADEAIPKFSKTTYTYKTVEQLEIQADVYRHADAVRRPVIVWLHGGALIMGSRSGVPMQLRTLAQEQGFVLVSLDYRLAPETQLPEIIEDLKGGLEWVQKTGPELFDADPSRLVVAGASAGGYLALMSGIVCNPAPTAIVSYWGFGDVDGDWTTQPAAAYRKGKLIDRDVAWSGVGSQALTSANKENGRGRAAFFLYLKQTGRWVNAVSGFDPKVEREKLTPFCPIRNLSAEYPPTLMLHGTADNDVPVGQSVAMAGKLKRLGVSHELITIEGGGHSLWGGDRKLIEQAFARSMEYIREHLETPSAAN
ncbi:MAG: alpha/beta hydrolase [Fuerstiella sp.]